MLATFVLAVWGFLLFPGSEPQTRLPLPAGYIWSKQLSKPDPLRLIDRTSYQSPGGWFDYCVTTVGDNWSISRPSPVVRVYQHRGSNVSLRFPASSQEPSCGWLIWRRGPYEEGAPEARRPRWVVGCPENAGPHPMVSMPIITHHGGDFQRWQYNGWVFQEAPGFTQDGPDGKYYRPREPVGPLQLDGKSRVTLPTPAHGPHVTLLSRVPNQPLYVAYCWVDMLGRESELSELIVCPPIVGESQLGTTLQLSRPCQPPQGACAVHVYAGTNPKRLHRQRVLNHQDAPANDLWPLHLTRYYLQALDAETESPAPGICQSILNPIQQDLEAGLLSIQREGKYELYCPLILSYDPNHFGRILGSSARRCALTHAPRYQERRIVGAVPAVLLLNQHDRIVNYAVESETAYACIATSDFSGGQSFSNQLIGCSFRSTADDAYGLLVDDSSSAAWGGHTASEMLIRNTSLSAARPVKLEGNQTAKIRFDDRCAFHCTGKSRYLNEVCALEIFTANSVVFDVIEGVNGLNSFRAFCGMYSNAGTPIVRIRDVFIDHGCSVLFAYGPNTGGVVELTDGDKVGVYAPDRQWFRLAECPNSNNSRLKIRGLNFPASSTVLSYNLNQLALDLDAPIAELVTPTVADWLARGLLVKFADKDWGKRPGGTYAYGWENLPNTVSPKSPAGLQADK
jgi:hypothetical protein